MTSVEYDLKEILGRIEKSVDDFRGEVRHELAQMRSEMRQDVGAIRDRVSKVEQRLTSWDEIGADRLVIFDKFRRDVEELRAEKIGEDAVVEYKTTIDQQRRWNKGFLVTLIALTASIIGILLTHIHF